MKFITFYSLPNDIAALILSKYLDWRSLCTLDSSCCMRESRKLLFVLWSSHHLVFHEIPLRDLLPELQTLCLNWVDKRSVKFTKVQVPGTVDVTTCDRLMRNRFSSVSLLAIEGREKSILAYLLSIATFKCKLIALSLIECNLSSTIGVILHNFPLLVELTLNDCSSFLEDDLQDAELPMLLTLSVARSDCDDSSLELLMQKSVNLINLNVSGAKDLTNEGILRALANHSHLRKLGLTDLEIIDEVVDQIALACPGLLEVDISDCDELTDASVTSLVTRCKMLKLLSLHNSRGFTDAALADISEHRPSILHLDIAFCLGVTRNGIKHMLLACTSIISLSVDAMTVAIVEVLPRGLALLLLTNTEVSDGLLVSIGARCTSLKELVFTTACTCTFTGKGLAALAWGCPHLKELLSCTEISPEAVAMWRNWRPNLTVKTDTCSWSLDIFSFGMTVNP